MGKHTPGFDEISRHFESDDNEAHNKLDALCQSHTALLKAARMVSRAIAWDEKRTGTIYNGMDSLRAAIAEATKD